MNLDVVIDEVQMLWWDQAVWRTHRARVGGPVVTAKGYVVDNLFDGWVEDLYYRRVYMTIRAMRDGDPRNYSFRTLLDRVKQNASEIECPVPEMRAPGSTTVDPVAVKADLDALEAAAAEVRAFVNKAAAHYDRSKLDMNWIPNSVAVDATVQLLGDLMLKYLLILRGEKMTLPTAPAW